MASRDRLMIPAHALSVSAFPPRSTTALEEEHEDTPTSTAVSTASQETRRESWSPGSPGGPWLRQDLGSPSLKRPARDSSDHRFEVDFSKCKR